jgi:hypothetical protein
LPLYFVQITSRVNFEVCLDKKGYLMIARHSFNTIFTIWTGKNKINIGFERIRIKLERLLGLVQTVNRLTNHQIA